MTQTRDNGIVVPVNSDPYNPTADLAVMADKTNVVTVVSTLAARNALTKYTGRTVRRLDLGGLLEWWNGSAWISRQHMEFTYSTGAGAIPDATTWGPGTLTPDTGAVTTDSSIASYVSADKISLSKAGLYSITFTAALGFVVTGTSWVQIRSSDDATIHAAGSISEYWGTASVPNYYATSDNTVLWLRFKQTRGGTNNSAGRLRVTRIG